MINSNSPAAAIPAGLVLAAGLSSRMKQFKPLLPLGGQSVLARVVGLLRDAGAAPVLVVLGHRAAELEPVVRSLGATPVLNPYYEQGMFSSLRAGLAALPPTCRAFFLLPVDIPLVRPHTLARLRAAWDQGRGPVLHPTFRGEWGHPPLIAANLAPAIMAYDGPGGLRGFWDLHPELAQEVAVADRFILRDQDHPQDYDALKAELPGYDTPDQAECLALLREVLQLEPELVAHSVMVGRVAQALAQAARKAGAAVSPSLALAGGLLHDVAKGQADHPAAGAELLAGLGFAAVAPLAARHVDIDLIPGAPLGEAELVHLADKLVQADRRVALGQRFEDKLARKGNSPEARAAIQRRWDLARSITQRVEAALSMGLEECLERADLAVENGKS
ncbi:MAG: NTP transferase domain-containing protein [Proteobacteria bacterium]|nr:NTP transferase domain-containing protein [Pseudomonadota bacterium]MBU4383306.1 NTP transferase domain-containing protein [Pseudomonadota bacterium]MBU4603952.1 NTP transferase domain-containing protein [Pseudomonadota bacterium]MCG2764345.1 NTP transferase domain-containing protein [Desulfarculaceae bacterium]